MVKRDAGASGVLVIGLGRFGSAVAASLESLEREVLAVEKSADRYPMAVASARGTS